MRWLSRSRSGHGGTLDPDAAGVLPVAVGRALSLLGRVDWAPKGYWGAAHFGLGTDTLDAAGEAVAWSAPPWPNRGDLERTAPFLRGRGLQVPPNRSSIKQGGERAYLRARRHETFSLPPRAIEVAALAVTGHDGRAFEFVTEVSSGTYVRALVRDWALLCGHAAHLVALIRTRAGPFRIDEAVTLEELEADGVESHLLSWRRVWTGPVECLTDDEARDVAGGRWPERVQVADGMLTALAADGRLYALSASTGRFVRVFPGGLW